MERFIVSAARKLAYVVAACVIVVAGFVVTAWLLAPYFDKHTADVENIASIYLKRPVKIERVRLSWDQYQPVISLHNVTVLDEASQKPVIQVERVSIFVSVWDSLRHLSFVPAGALVRGTEVSVQQNAAGEFTIQGFPVMGADQPYQSETKFRDILTVLFQQSRIILRDIDVRYVDHVGLKREVTLHDLSMKNSGAEHTVIGKAVLHQDIPTEVQISVNMRGTAEAYEQLKADIYLYISGFSISQWLKGVAWHSWRLSQGLGSAKIWATWEQGAFQRFQTTFQLYNLRLYSETDKTTHVIDRFSGDIGWRQNGTEQIIAADDLLINFPQHLWPVTSFYVAVEQNADGSYAPKKINLGYIDIGDIESFLFSSPALISADVKKMLVGSKFDGELQHTAVTFNGAANDWQHMIVDADFNRLSSIPWQRYPGIKNLSGTAKWDGAKGVISLKSQGLEFRDDAIFANVIVLDQVSGDITVQQVETAWQLSTSALHLLNKDLTANVNGTFTMPENGEVESDIKANFSLANAKHAPQYLPLKIFSAGLVKWLNEAFLVGRIEAGTGQVTGKLKDFPFENGGGIFNITGTVKNIEFKFAPTWPELTQVGGKIVFSGNQMSVDATQGWLMDIPITNAHAEIPYLGDAKPNMLYVKSENITSDMKSAMAFVHASPLQEGIGRMFDGMDLSGPISLNLNLTMPLADPDKIHIEGDLALKDVDMNLVPWDLRVDKLSGMVHFTEATTSSSPLTGLLFNKPLTVQLATVTPSKAAKSVVRAQVTNNLAIDDVEKWLKIPLAKIAKGATDIKGAIDFALDAPINIKISSDLKGVTLDLPDGYAKSANVARAFTADFSMQEGKPLRAKMSYGQLLSAALILDRVNGDFKLTGADLRLGGGDPAWPESAGIYITGTLDKLDWDKIKSYIDQASDGGSDGLKGYTLKEIDVLIKQLSVFGQQLTSAQVQLTPSAKSWLIDISSPQVSGSITVPLPFARTQTIKAQFDRLQLAATASGSSPMAIDLKTLPGISLVAKEVNYNNMQLGQVTIETRPAAEGQIVETLDITSNNVVLRSSGSWLPAGKGYKSKLSGTVDSDRVSDFLNGLGVDAHNFIANKGHVEFDLSWNDAFYSPDVASLNGSFSIDLGPGRIVDLGDSGGAKMDLGKLLNIFSLQTIPRRLSLDFSDITQKGYSFDFMRGDYTAKSGNVFTNNMRIEGPVAKVTINGRIGLTKKDLDLMMNVTPYVTSSLPVAAGLITANPLIGLGALAVNTVIGSQVSKVITYRYDVAGTWSNPTWQQAETR